MRLILIIVTIFFSQSGNAQLGDINTLKFSFDQSLTETNVNIQFTKRLDSTELKITTVKIVDLSYKNREQTVMKKEVFRTKNIRNAEFEKIILIVKSISPKDMTDGFSGGNDGSKTILEFGNSFNSIQYSIWSLKMSDNESKLSEFLKATTEILRLADLEPAKFYN